MDTPPLRFGARTGLATLVAASLSSISAHAADPYPNAPIKLVVAYAAGGGTDAVARAIAQSLGTRLGQPVIVENKPGAGGSLGTAAGATAAPDGYTFTLGSNGTMVLNPLLYSTIKYQVDRDFVAVSGIASIPYLIASNPQVNATDIRSLVELGKKQKLSFASPGNGTTNHLVGVLLESMAKVDMLHVPYRGASPAMNDVVSGQVNFLSGDLATLMPMVTAGKLRALAVTGQKRVDALPNVPTVAESGFPGFDATGWFGLFAPRGTPASIVEKVSFEMGHVLKDPRVIQRLRDLGGAPMQFNADQLKDLVKGETQKWRKVITDNHVTADALQ
ncbi:Bug family tripartite tricarboxylate transporter substrate binding protein [Hydrogenophaga sp. OTU3427]|uniref:Bug family tripartite tricarboxylate transporter substrate binding protein n=1 Tax=Hydrogenophaga sp. OTU3427 TaxID=3043856 RepID=UPI00313C8427